MNKLVSYEIMGNTPSARLTLITIQSTKNYYYYNLLSQTSFFYLLNSQLHQQTREGGSAYFSWYPSLVDFYICSTTALYFISRCNLGDIKFSSSYPYSDNSNSDRIWWLHIHINFNFFVDHVMKVHFYSPYVCCTSILKTKWYYPMVKNSPGYGKSHFLCVFIIH